MGFWGGYDLIFFFLLQSLFCDGLWIWGVFWILFVSYTVAGVMNLVFYFILFDCGYIEGLCLII